MSGSAASLSEQLTTLAELLAVHVVPIMQDCDRGLPKSIGSGLLVKHLSTPYIATAAHVFSHHLSDRPLYFYCTSQRKHFLVGVGAQNPLVPTKQSGTATLDVAIMALVGNANPSLKLGQKSCMSSDDLVQLHSDHGSLGLRTHFLLTGFPASRGKIKRRTNEFESEMWSLLCREGKLEDCVSLGFDPVHFLLLRLDNKDLTRNGQRVTAPDLHGVSGSPIWIIGSEGLKRQIPGNCVAGFAIEHPLPQQAKVIVAVRSGAAKHLLLKAAELSVTRRIAYDMDENRPISIG